MTKVQIYTKKERLWTTFLVCALPWPACAENKKPPFTQGGLRGKTPSEIPPSLRSALLRSSTAAADTEGVILSEAKRSRTRRAMRSIGISAACAQDDTDGGPFCPPPEGGAERT